MDVQMPDGTIVTDVPDDVTQSALLERYKSYQPPAGLASLSSALPPTSNPLYGLVSRTGSLIGEGIEGVARVAEKVGDKLESVLPLSNLTAEQIANQRQLEPLFKFAESTKNWAKGINYEPSTKLADLASNPLNAVPFIVERVISSSPDMAASVVAMPAYVAARTNEILNDRLTNDEKKLDDATVADVTAALGGAIMESTLERFATKHLFKGKPISGKSATTRVAKEVGIQSGTEGAEEAIGYLAGTVGTKKGVDSKELGESILEGAIVGGGLGGGVRGTREYLDYRKKKQEAADAITKEDEGIVPPIEDTVKTGDLTRQMADLTSPIVATMKTTVDGKEVVKTTRADGSVDIDGVLVTPPRQEPEGNVAQSREQMLAEFEGRQLPLAAPPVAQPAPTVQSPVERPPLSPANPVESAPPMPIAPDGQLPLAPVNPEGTVLPAPTPPAAPVVAQLPLAQVNPEGTVIAPPKPVDPNVEAQLAAVEPDVEGMILNEPPPPPKVKAIRTPKAPEAPRINYGVDADGNAGVSFEDGGLPFPNRAAAKKANKSGMKVVAVDGGFALADKTEKDIANDKVRAKNLKSGPKGFLSAHAYIASLGGLNKNEASEIDPDAAKSNIKVGNKYVYASKGGLSMGEAATALKQEGYIESEDNNEALRVLSESINEPVYSMRDADAIAEQQFEAKKQQEADEFAQQEAGAAKEAELVNQENSEYANYLAIEMEFGDSAKSMLDAGYTQQDLNVVGFTKASPELQAEVAALEEQIKDLGLDVADVLEALQYSPKTTELEYYTRAKSELAKTIAAAAKQGSGGNVSQANVSAAQEGSASSEQKAVNATKELPELDTTGLKIPKKRNPQVVAAGKLFQAGKMSREDFNAYVDKNTPIKEVSVDTMEAPTSAEAIKAFFKSPEDSERVQHAIPNGKQVGLRMDVPALNAGLPVVSIHEGKPNDNPRTKQPYAKAGEVIKYASTGHIKGVTFAPRSQEKSLNMGLNPVKEPLQTAEGEWVNTTPEETFKRVKELSNDKSWTQVGFDPARHGYFYERSTGNPVASASELYQIGRFLLAKDVKYAPKSDFLYSKTSAQPSAGDRAKVLSVAQSVSADWAVVPDVVVVDNMQSDGIPQEAQDYDKTQTGGTTKNPDGFYYRGKIYLLASQLKDEKDIVRVMNHEVLGHYGLRGLFGEALTPILDQLAKARRDLVQERADAYGLDMNNQNDRRQAAEEALAILAQTRPELGFVKRAVAAIRTWLREHGFKNLKLTDDQIINDYIVPARNFIERGTKSAKDQLSDIRYSRKEGQANSAAFKKWSNNAPLVNAKNALTYDFQTGSPFVAESYHGTSSKDDFSAFDLEKGGYQTAAESASLGVFSTNEPLVAQNYAENIGFGRYLGLAFKFPEELKNDPEIKRLQEIVNNAQKNAKDAFEEGRQNAEDKLLESFKETNFGKNKKAVYNMALMMFRDKDSGDIYSKADNDKIDAADKAMDDAQRVMSDYIIDHETKKIPQRIMPLYVKMKNPKVYDAEGKTPADFPLTERIAQAKNEGHDGVVFKNIADPSPIAVHYVAFAPTQLKSAIGNTGAFSSESNDIRYSKSGASLQKPKPAASWTAPDMNRKDTFIGLIQDKNISLKRVQQVIEKLPTVTQLQDNLNAYRLEDLAHGRVQVQTDDFLKFEFAPIIKEMNDNKVTEEQLTEYLLNRHAKEANELIAKRNPNNPAMQDKGSSVETKVAEDYLKNLPPAQKKLFESLAKKVDKVIVGTQELLYKNGIISKAELDGWRDTFKYYVPLRREETDYVLPSSSFKEIGSYAKSRTGSFKKVTDILSNVGIAREIAIVRSEKERAKRAVYGLAIANPNPEFWMAVSPAAVLNQNVLIQELTQMGWDAADIKNIMAEPTKAYFNKDTGLVEHKINTQNRYADFVLPVKINGQDRFVFFNPNDKRAASVITALKNSDTQKLSAVTSYVGNITRYFAAVNTQYNLVFGAWNFARDVQGAMLNLTTTPLNGKQSAVAKGTFSALKDIYAGIKEKNQGTLQTNPADGSWQDFLEAGGKVGYRDQFAKINDTSTLVARELQSLNRGNVYKKAKSVLNWVSSVNDVMENAVRLSAYRVALKQNMSKDQAAEIAKNLTVNFNRKGSATAGLSAYYAFLNASIQGTARLAQTIDPRTKSGRAIIAGGMAIGMAQSLMLMAAGFDDDEPSEFLKERNFIIPTGWLTGKRTYAMWPYPLGFNILPNTGRLLIDGAARLADGKGVGDIAINALSMAVSSTNPLGGNAATLQSYMPTVIDPFVAVYENKDAFGRPIAKEDRGLNPTPGYTRSREPANPIFQGIAEFMNTITSRDKDVKGFISPTADQLSYIAEQVGGGVYREASRAVKYAVNVLNGEETPEHQVPIAGKIVGDLDSNAAISQKFYTNVKNMAEHELVIKAHRERRESVSEYMRDNPEARLWQRANSLENEITKLNKTKKELYQREAPQDRIKRVEDQKIRMMKQFNDQVRRVN